MEDKHLRRNELVSFTFPRTSLPVFAPSCSRLSRGVEASCAAPLKVGFFLTDAFGLTCCLDVGWRSWACKWPWNLSADLSLEDTYGRCGNRDNASTLREFLDAVPVGCKGHQWDDLRFLRAVVLSATENTRCMNTIVNLLRLLGRDPTKKIDTSSPNAADSSVTNK